LYSLLHRHASVDQKDTAASNSETTHSSGQVHDKVHSLLKNSRTAQIILFIVVMLGTCLVIGDGILTPAISGKNILPQNQMSDSAWSKL
jgi:KUP system potassium uptake protein